MKELYEYLITIKQNQMDIALNGDTEVLVNCKDFHQWFELKITPSEKKGQRYKITMRMNLPAWLGDLSQGSYEANTDTKERVAMFLSKFFSSIYFIVVNMLRGDTINNFNTWIQDLKLKQLNDYTQNKDIEKLLSDNGYKNTTNWFDFGVSTFQSDTDNLQITVEGDTYIITDITINENLMYKYGLKPTTPEEVINIVVKYKNHKWEDYKRRF